ncbi:hypothetical protein GG670_28035 [Pseudomonas aeruginosa]|nr:hypothetical protein [Pseudomonas aeruginosa]
MEQVARWPWNAWPDESGLGGRMAWNPQLGKWKRQYEQQGDYAFPGNGKQRGESAELRRLRQQLAQVTMERDVLKKALAIFSLPTK